MQERRIDGDPAKKVQTFSCGLASKIEIGQPMPLSPLGNPRVLLITIGMALNFYGCSRDPVVTHAAVIRSEPAPTRHVRATGTVQASHVFMVQVPQISGQGGRMTLTRLVPNGVRVKQGDTGSWRRCAIVPA